MTWSGWFSSSGNTRVFIHSFAHLTRDAADSVPLVCGASSLHAPLSPQGARGRGRGAGPTGLPPARPCVLTSDFPYDTRHVWADTCGACPSTESSACQPTVLGTSLLGTLFRTFLPTRFLSPLSFPFCAFLLCHPPFMEATRPGSGCL